MPLILLNYFIKYRRFIWSLLLILLVAFAFSLAYYKGYSTAKEKYNKNLILYKQSQDILNKQETISALRVQIAENKKQLANIKANEKTITKYRTKKEIILKEVPKIEKKIEKIYIDKPNDFISDDIVGLHDEFLCQTYNDNEVSTDGDTCRADGTPEGAKNSKITQKEFLSTVMQNYAIAIENKEKLKSLQQVINEQNAD